MSTSNTSQTRLTALLAKLRTQLTEQEMQYYESPKGHQSQLLFREITRLEAAVRLLEYQLADDDTKALLAAAVIQAQTHYIRELEQSIAQYEARLSAADLPPDSDATKPAINHQRQNHASSVATALEAQPTAFYYVRTNRQPPADQPIDELELDAKVYKSLHQHHAGMTTVELINLLIDEPEELLKIRRIGEYSTQHIAQRLRFKGYIDVIKNDG